MDVTQLQAAIANAEQVVDALAPLIPGPMGDKVRAVVGLIETLDKNPLLLQVVLFVVNNLDKIKTPADVTKLFEGFTVVNTVA